MLAVANTVPMRIIGVLLGVSTMTFDYVMATCKNGDRITVSFAEPKNLGTWLRVEIEEKMDEIRTISFSLAGKPVMSMTVFA
jgi:hypothetical protein